MKKKRGSKVAWVGFVDYVLTSSDRENFLAWDGEDQEIWGHLSDLALNGYKVSFSYNKKSDSYVCSLSSMSDVCSLPGYTLSSWAKDIYQAARLAVYKHVILCEGDWTKLASSESADFG